MAIHAKSGVRAERVPLSGASRYQGNGAYVDLYVRGTAPIKAEVKARADGTGFRTLERWLGSNDALFLVRDRTEPLVVLPLRIWLEVACRSAKHDADCDRTRCERRSAIERGPLPRADAIARRAA